jgi:putative sigma-54 modulation protein
MIALMKLIISGKNIEITDALREKVTRKVGKLDKFFNHDIEAHATLSTEKNRHIVEVTIPFNGIILRAEVSSEDMYNSIDKVQEILERQIRRNKTRLSKKVKGGGFKADSFDLMVGGEEEQEYRIVRSKKFSFKPMDIDEAILQMNLVGHEFFMFVNAETKDVNVVYKRKDGNYGLIEPEL